MVTNWTAFAAVTVGPLVGAVGIVAGALTAKGERSSVASVAREQREHELQIARETRIHEELRAGYTLLLTLAYELSDHVEGTYPVQGEPLTIEPMSREELNATRVKASVISSRKVQAAMDELWRTWEDFAGTVATLNQIFQANREIGNARQDLEDSRETFRAALLTLQSRIAAEVRGEV